MNGARRLARLSRRPPAAVEGGGLRYIVECDICGERIGTLLTFPEVARPPEFEPIHGLLMDPASQIIRPSGVAYARPRRLAASWAAMDRTANQAPGGCALPVRVDHKPRGQASHLQVVTRDLVDA